MGVFQEYKKTVGEGNERRVFTVEARQSDGDETVTTTGGPRNVNKGEYVIRTNNPNVFDVETKEEWGKRNFDHPQRAAKGGSQ